MSALFLILFLTACGTNKQARLNAAAQAQAQADLVAAAIAQSTIQQEQRDKLPYMPAECVGPVKAGLDRDDEPDVVGSKYDKALGDANYLLRNCYYWYDHIRASREKRAAE